MGPRNCPKTIKNLSKPFELPKSVVFISRLYQHILNFCFLHWYRGIRAIILNTIDHIENKNGNNILTSPLGQTIFKRGEYGGSWYFFKQIQIHTNTYTYYIQIHIRPTFKTQNKSKQLKLARSATPRFNIKS